MTQYVAFGDSLTNPTGQSVVGYIPMLNAQMGVSFTNLAHSGDQINDQLKQIYTINPNGGDKFLLACGINDMRNYSKNNITQGRTYYSDAVTCGAAWLSLVNKQTARDPACIKNGSSWANAQIFNIGLRASTIGDYCTFNVQGSTIYIAVQVAEPAGQNGTYNLSIDGGTSISFDSSTPGITSVNGFPYSDRLHRFVMGGSPTDFHTIKWMLTGATYGYPEWAAGNYQTSFPSVCVGNITRLSNITGLTNFGYASWGGSDAVVSTWNDDTAIRVTNLATDGLDVRLVNSWGVVNPITDLSQADGLHWAQSGQLSVFGEFSKTLTTPAYTTTTVYKRNDGLFFIDDGINKTRIITSP